MTEFHNNIAKGGPVPSKTPLQSSSQLLCTLVPLYSKKVKGAIQQAIFQCQRFVVLPFLFHTYATQFFLLANLDVLAK